MKLNRTLYFGDFVVIPIAILVMISLGLTQSGAAAALPIASSLMFGVLLWTLVEYFVHRTVYHHAPLFTRLHGAHHEDPAAFLGLPSFLSSGLIIGAIFLPLYGLDVAMASGLTSGMLLGYGYYMLAHHAAHHFVLKPGDILYGARLRHMGHHYHDHGNFGVTTGLWDAVFATRLERRSQT